MNEIILQKKLKKLGIFSLLYGLLKLLISVLFFVAFYLANSTPESYGIYDSVQQSVRVSKEQSLRTKLEKSIITYYNKQKYKFKSSPSGVGMALMEFCFILITFFNFIVSILTIFSGIFILLCRWGKFSIFVAYINLLSFPIGTLLAVFSIILLIKPSVREIYGTNN